MSDANKNSKEKEENPSKPNESPSNDQKKKNEITTPVLMKKGDYTVHVLIEEIKNLVPKEPDFLPFPVIKVSCFNKAKRTPKIQSRCLEYTFNEHMYFECTDMSYEELNSEKIIIEAFDSKNTDKEDYFGIYEFDLEYIYTSPKHSIKNLWIALANPEAEDITQVRGYLKLSISVLNENDDRIELLPNVSKNSDCIIPPQIKISYQQISIYIFKAEDLPDMDNVLSKEKKVNRECNGYIECNYMGMTKSTKVVDMVKEVIQWNEIIDISVSVPAVSQKITFTVKDANKISKDAIIGSFELTVHDILNGNYDKLQEVNIYGSPINDSGKVAKKMNTNAEFGSRWKGRLYMKVSFGKVDTPINGVRPINDQELIKTVYNTSRANLWSIYVKLYDAFYLPEKEGKFGIRISMQSSTGIFNHCTAVNRNIQWNHTKTLQCQTLTSSVNELPDLFIHLVNDRNEAICFQRIKASEFHMNDDIMMIKLIPDPCIGKVSQMYLSGILKLRIKLFNRVIDKGEINVSYFKDGPDNTNSAMKSQASGPSQSAQIEEDEDDLEALYSKKTEASPPLQKAPTISLKSYTIVANIYMTRYLIAGDWNGTSDPYTQLSIFSQEKKTSTKNDSVNGIWNESLIYSDVKFDLDDQSTWPVMLLTVMDEDIASSDMLGYTYVWLSDSCYEINNCNVIRPKWHQLYLEKSNRPQGQILISFYVFDKEHENLINKINIIPETMPYTVEINALGLRNLKPLSFLPVKKAYVSFDLNSINVTGRKEDALAAIKTQPTDSGENPNLACVIQFDVRLPKDEVFIPEMQCEVYDHVLGGLINQSLGIFILPIKDIIQKTHEGFEEEIYMTKRRLEQAQNADVPIIQNKQREDDERKETSAIDDKYICETELSLKAPLVDKDDNCLQIPNTSAMQNEFSILCNTVDDLDHMYRGVVDTKEILENRDNSMYYVLKPSFKLYTIPGVKQTDRRCKEFLIEDEDNCPSTEYYFPLGFNKLNNASRANDEVKLQGDEQERNRKHYRRIYGRELERVEELGLASPFTTSRLVRGKYNDISDVNGLFEAISNKDNKIIKRYYQNTTDKEKESMEKEKTDMKGIKKGKALDSSQQNIASAFDMKYYGIFKGLLRISEKNKLKKHNDLIEKIKQMHNNKIPMEYDYLTKFEEISRHMLIKKKVIIRVYILELNNLAKKDAFSESDPYIKILIGKEVKINEKDNQKNDSKDCKWYKHYDIQSELPGNGSMTIQVFDYDPMFSDELIGQTVIDLEDRYFDHQWQDLINKPIEVRRLRHVDFNKPQGEILMFLEIFDKNNRINMKPWDIEPEPESAVEMRLIIWETENMECMDVEGTSDIYVVAYLDQELKQSTDIHFRCQNGAASFNWRMVVPIALPRSKNDLIFQVYDNDILARDDYICGAKMNLYRLIRDVNALDVPITFNKEYYEALPPDEKFSNVEFLSKTDDPDGEKFWVQMVKGENDDKKGRVMCSLEIVPKWRADMTKVGKGRDEPNVDPYLPAPVGRIEFTLNPFKMLNQFVGPKFRRKLYSAICCCVFVTYLIIIIPYILYHLGGELVNPFNYIKRKVK